MDLFDSLKSRLNGILPQHHRWLLLALAAVLVIITHEGEYQGPSLVARAGKPAADIAVSMPAQDAQYQDQYQELAPESPATASSEKIAEASLVPMLSREARFTDTEKRLQQKAVIIEPDYVTEVKPGDNLSLIFDRAGLTPRDVYQVSRSKPESSLLTNLYPGYKLEFFLDENRDLENLVITRNKLASTEHTRSEDGTYTTHDITREPEIRQVFREATIDDSMFMAAKRGGISDAVTMELAGIFGGVIDFLLDTRNGDTFNLLYEEKYLDGEYIGNGAILAAQFTNQGETYTAVRYINTAGDIDFYNPQGESMRKAFLRNPVDFTRISSGFSLSRKHPILNTIRAHKGTDYAAPRGTPVIAAGDGRVTWAARNGSFGKLVVVQHGERFQTKYAHLNTYARGVKQGARVKQGQIIGYVGSTGSATGPHLHYEFLMDGVHRNSRTIHDQLPKAESIPESELQRFREHTQILLSRLENHASNTKNIALVEFQP